MTTAFDTSQNIIIVRVHLWGPTQDIYGDFVLDTGAVDVVVSAKLLASIGYDLAKIVGRVRVTTASGVEFLPRLALNKLEALGQ